MSAVFFTASPGSRSITWSPPTASTVSHGPPNAAGPWVVVARARGFTKWRHIRISHIDISVADVLSLRRNK